MYSFRYKKQKKYEEEKDLKGRPLYNFFGEYVTKALNISESKANSYIKLWDKFGKNKQDLNPQILVSHLKLIMDLSEKNRDVILKAINNYQTERQVLKTEIFTEGNNVKKDVSKLRADVESGEIQAISTIAENVGIENDEDANNLLKELVEQKQEDKNEKRNSQKILSSVTESTYQNVDYNEDDNEPIYYGNDLQSDYFDVTEIFRHEPVDEQGLVGLFCCLFHLIKQRPFIFHEKEISFKSIKVIRQAYPDGVLQILNIGKDKKYTDMNVEFEFKSHNFIKHNHLSKSKLKCHLIICWENNIKGKTLKKYLDKLQKKGFPKILSIKDVLKTGKIELQ